ncbi:hypothetical protein [Fulvivirga ligni]|uniref:hypothetical protein n=1 Tax=Fulvivirga ligni TaxID=2904246 RepID=UPI001F3BB44F|nr:hypothetical protein [Fulvivirga ligni]UII20852.1 hypothetical protein LVD16_23710 [Fulvivirga ligni]
MDIFNQEVSLRKLFQAIYSSGTEDELQQVIDKHPEAFKNENWHPLGNNPSNYGVIENQQSNPIAALIEKLTNSIDAILTKKCLEADINPKDEEAPRSMEEALDQFFPDASHWDLSSFRKAQSESLQIIADGPRKKSSLIIYDDGEGQHPKDFKDTFLSLLKGNKNEIHFVQGKYNMGGSGAIVFCGKKGYQLIGSRKFDKTGEFGFTLIREHPLTKEEKITKKNTWYEYFQINGVIPSFEIEKLDLGLHNRWFETGTVIKLYSYDLPSGSRSVISRDLNQSINEYLFQPALPILTVDTKERYPDDRNLERPLYGLKRRLEQDDSKYIEDYFSETYSDELFGDKGVAKVTCYIFKNKIDDKSAKETKDTIRREFFKNNMSVLFSVNGQVHGHYTSEFIVRSLQMNMLRHHLIIHVDCTNMDIDFRNKLFMASRDRLKDGEETRSLREFLSKKLKANERLKEIFKRRKQIGSLDQTDTKELLRSITKDLPLNDELRKLISDTLKLDKIKDNNKPKHKTGDKKDKKEKESFNPNRFPTNFKLKLPEKGGIKAVNIPRGSEKRILFDTDVENNYFDRVDEPGELKIALAQQGSKKDGPPNPKPEPNEVEEVFNIVTSSPKDGKIRISLTPNRMVNVGDNIPLKVTLTGPGKDFEEIFWAKITEPEKPKQPLKKKQIDNEDLGIPELITVYENKRDGSLSWEEVADFISDDFNYYTVMYPQAKGESELEKVFINMESNVFKSFLSKYKNPNEHQFTYSENKYKSAVYFHTLFLYAITKKRGFEISKPVDGMNSKEVIDIGEYLRDVFDHYYSTFLLNFGGMEEMMMGVVD